MQNAGAERPDVSQRSAKGHTTRRRRDVGRNLSALNHAGLLKPSWLT